MITKAIITKVPGQDNTNQFYVNVPFFNTAGNTIEESIPAYVCTQMDNQTTRDFYSVDDVVYIGFEDNEYSTAVILGKLYKVDN